MPEQRGRNPSARGRTQLPVARRPYDTPSAAFIAAGDVPVQATALDVQEGAVTTRSAAAGHINPLTLTALDEVNLVPDGSFELEHTRRNLTGLWEPTSDSSGAGLFSATNTSPDPDGEDRRHILRQRIPMLAADRLYLTWQVRITTGTGTSLHPMFGATWVDDDGEPIDDEGLAATTYDDAWHSYETVLTAPTGTVSMDLWMQLPAGMVTGERVWVDGLYAVQGVVIVGRKVIILDEAANLTTLQIEDSRGVYWTETATGLNTGRVNGSVADDANQYFRQMVVRARPEPTDSDWPSPNGREGALVLASKRDKVGTAHYGESRLQASRGGSSDSVTEIRVIDSHATPAADLTKGSSIVLERVGTGSELAKLYIACEPQANGFDSRYAAGCWAWFDSHSSNVALNNPSTTVDIVNVDVPTIVGRRYSVEAKFNRWASTATGDVATFVIEADGVDVDSWRSRCDAANVGAHGATYSADYVADATETVTFIFRMDRSSGTGDFTLAASAGPTRAWIRVTDIGY